MTTNTFSIPELLAPAGSFEKLVTAIHYGADAVYLAGKRFSLRARAGNFDEQGLQEAVNYATTGQVRRIEKFVCNIPANWKFNTVARPALDFIASKYLFLLSSLQAQGCSEAASESFARVWKALEATGWLERPEFMLPAAPIRAAAGVYGVNHS